MPANYLNRLSDFYASLLILYHNHLPILNNPLLNILDVLRVLDKHWKGLDVQYNSYPLPLQWLLQNHTKK
jgi:hypothetical protein